MILTLNQEVYGFRNNLYGRKNEKVELVSDEHLPVLLVQSLSTGERFPVKVEGTDYEEVKNKKP